MAGEAPGKKANPTSKRVDDSKRVDADRMRTIAARAVWLVFVLCALALAVAALLYALAAEPTNNLVDLFYSVADRADLGLFDLEEPIKRFTDEDPDEALRKTALFNYGIGAILYLIVGRVVEKLIHP